FRFLERSLERGRIGRPLLEALTSL
ncbi:MAG: hypothetical protein RLZZ117_341, partial [Cyanobacteriota bacterium]